MEFVGEDVPDDVLEYQLFPLLPACAKSDSLTEALEELKNSYLGHVNHFLVDYIWQKASFSLSIVADSDGLPPHFCGKTDVDGNSEDEWFIVFLLVQLTRSNPGLVVSVHDGDGEFLLIEAANSLPKWLDPQTATNRVFVVAGALHIIPMAQHPGEITTLPYGVPSVSDAVACVRDHTSITEASREVQQAVSRRWNKFPAAIKEGQHASCCFLPLNAAAVLKHIPQAVSWAVHALSNRDIVDRKVLFTRAKIFSPDMRVMSKVQFTKLLYAQLMHEDIRGDPKQGWTVAAGSNEALIKAHTLGMKLAIGLEILCASTHSAAASVDKPCRASSSAEWQRFVTSLRSSGYFKGEVEGSKLYKELYSKAQDYFEASVSDCHSDESHAAMAVLALLESKKPLLSDWVQEELTEDDDSWLWLNPTSLDAMLNEATGERLDCVSKVPESMNAFIQKESNILDGSEFPDSARIDFNADDIFKSLDEFLGKRSSNRNKADEDISEGTTSDSEGTTSDSEDNVGLDSSDDAENEDKDAGEIRAMKNRKQAEKGRQSMEDFMELMDRELASTTIGKSFEKKISGAAAAGRPNAASVVTEELGNPCHQLSSIEDEVDIDLNTVTNLLRSYAAQCGLPGPTSSILGSMGINLPLLEPSNDQP